MKHLPIEDFDIENLKGKQLLRLDTLTLADNSPISIPCGVISKGEGEKVCIISGQHGNEWNGIYASQRLFKLIKDEKVEGTLLTIPIANPPAFNEKNRVSGIDNIDLNRTYNGTNRKTTGHLGSILFENIISNMDYIVDLHGGSSGEYLPHVTVLDRKNTELASKFLIPDVYLTSKTIGSLADACKRRDIDCFTIEAGKQRDINYSYVSSITSGIRNFLKNIKLLEGNSKKKKTGIHHNKRKIPSPISGFFRAKTDLGEQIQEGETVGEIEKLFGEETKLKSPISGKVIYIRREGAVAQGENLLHILW